MSTIFLSYARQDDEPFVERLRNDLTARGFTVWWDRDSMSSRGLTFHHEILDAIGRCERLVLVVGPQAVASEYVRQEWMFAWSLAEKIVTPILRQGDFPLVPDELKRLHCEDFRDDARYEAHLVNLCRQLREPPPPLGTLIGVPGPPPHPIPREELLDAIQSALRADLDRPEVVSRAAARVGLYGMGGIGKSVLASDLVRRRDIRKAYPDGIVWVHLGTQPLLPELMRRVHRDLGGDGEFFTEHEGKVRLRELLVERAVLLVLDDAWQRAHIDAFDVLGPRCRALITTRDAGLLASLGGVHYPVDLLSEEEALYLLASTADVARGDMPKEAVEIVNECGRLPLAVALCGGRVKRSMGDKAQMFGEVLCQLQEARIERIADERYVMEPQHRSVWYAIQISVESLAEEERQRFLEMAVFVPDEPTPEAAIATLWSHTGSLDDWESRRLLESLAERSLMQLNRSGHDGRLLRDVVLHDLIYDYLQRACENPEALHQRLIAAYAGKYPGGWSTLPRDDYGYHHLAHHLAEAGDGGGLSKLVLSGELDLIDRWTARGHQLEGKRCLEGVVDYLGRVARDRESAAACATQLGRVCGQLGQFDESEQALQRALRLAPFWRSWSIRAVALHELASLRLYRGDRSAAWKLYRRALRLCTWRIPLNHPEAAANQVALATIALSRHEHARAIRWARLAIRHAEKSGDVRHVIASHRILGNALKETLCFDAAVEEILTGRMLCRLRNLPYDEPGLMLALAWLKYDRLIVEDRHDIEPVQDAFLEALQQSEAVHHLPYRVEALLGLFWSAGWSEDAEAAAGFLQRAAEAHVSQKYSSLGVALRIAEAALAHLRGDLNRAVHLYEEGCTLSRERNETSWEADAHVGLANVFHQRGVADDAEWHRQAALTLAGQCSPEKLRLVEKGLERQRIRENSPPF